MEGPEEQRDADAAGVQAVVDRLEAVLGGLGHQVGADPGAAGARGQDRPVLDLGGDLLRGRQVLLRAEAWCGPARVRQARLPLGHVQLRPLLEYERGPDERLLELQVLRGQAADLVDRRVEAGAVEEPLEPPPAAQWEIP